MGGCCCSSRKPHLRGTPVFYYCPSALEEHGPLTSRSGAVSAFTAGLLVELNLNTESPDTFRSPPAPLPYDLVPRCPQSTDSETVHDTISCSSFETLATEDLAESDLKTHTSSLLVSPRKSETSKPNDSVMSATEEEDACPICLEEYDTENPKLITKCDHQFHLSCLLEWMERSETCPMCDQVWLKTGCCAPQAMKRCLTILQLIHLELSFQDGKLLAVSIKRLKLEGWRWMLLVYLTTGQQTASFSVWFLFGFGIEDVIVLLVTPVKVQSKGRSDVICPYHGC